MRKKVNLQLLNELSKLLMAFRKYLTHYNSRLSCGVRVKVLSITTSGRLLLSAWSLTSSPKISREKISTSTSLLWPLAQNLLHAAALNMLYMACVIITGTLDKPAGPSICLH